MSYLIPNDVNKVFLHHSSLKGNPYHQTHPEPALQIDGHCLRQRICRQGFPCQRWLLSEFLSLSSRHKVLWDCRVTLLRVYSQKRYPRSPWFQHRRGESCCSQTLEPFDQSSSRQEGFEPSRTNLRGHLGQNRLHLSIMAPLLWAFWIQGCQNQHRHRASVHP